MQKTEIVEKLGDADFQAAMLADPHQALRNIGVELPATTEIKVVCNSKDNLNIAMPVANASDTALSDDQLGQLSAGEIFISILVAVGVGATVATGAALGYGAGEIFFD